MDAAFFGELLTLCLKYGVMPDMTCDDNPRFIGDCSENEIRERISEIEHRGL